MLRDFFLAKDSKLHIKRKKCLFEPFPIAQDKLKTRTAPSLLLFNTEVFYLKIPTDFLDLR